MHTQALYNAMHTQALYSTMYTQALYSTMYTQALCKQVTHRVSTIYDVNNTVAVWVHCRSSTSFAKV